MAHQYLLNDVPADLRSELISEARHRLTSLTSHVNGILAARYEIPYTPPTGGGRPLHPNGDPMLLKIPDDVMKAIRREADKEKVTFRSVILTACSEHFGMEPPPARKVNPKKRPGAPRTYYRHGRPRGRKS